MTRIDKPIEPENGLFGAFESILGTWYTSTPEPTPEPVKPALSGRDWAFLMGLQSDLEHAATLLPILKEEMMALKNEITSEATRYDSL